MLHNDLYDEKLANSRAQRAAEKLYSRRQFMQDIAALLGLGVVSGAVLPTIAHGLLEKGLTLQPPPEPIDGIIIDNMDDDQYWQVLLGNGAINASISVVEGHGGGQAIQLDYDLGSEPGAWVQIKREFSEPLDLSVGDHLKFYYRGTASNTLEVGFVDFDGNYFVCPWHEATKTHWTYGTWDFQDFRRDDTIQFPNFSQVQAIFISVSLKNNGEGGPGEFTVDKLQYLQSASRSIPMNFASATIAPSVAQKAANWIAGQQMPEGLLKSWDEPANNAWLYDQALALLVLTKTHVIQARRLAETLETLQNTDGSWYAGYNYKDNSPIEDPKNPGAPPKPIGANAWLVYALSQHAFHCNPSFSFSSFQSAQKGASWLAEQQRQDGSLPALPGETTAPTEPNLGAWWAFQVTGFQGEADELRSYLLNEVWDPDIMRFKSSGNAYIDRYRIFLDNQTWGASFLKAVGEEEKARQALSYARQMLTTVPAEGECGFDGAGPFGVWNEGTLQYIVAGGEDSQEFADCIVAQQSPDGSLPGSPIDFQGYIVWLTKMAGLAPTCWLYFAGTNGPFSASYTYNKCYYLPIMFK